MNFAILRGTFTQFRGLFSPLLLFITITRFRRDANFFPANPPFFAQPSERLLKQHLHLPGAWPVEFAQIHPLPRPETKPPAADRDRQRIAQQRRLDVGRAVALRMAVKPFGAGSYFLFLPSSV